MSPRVASLAPAATELVCALGAGDELVGVSHECDWPPEVRGLPVLTRSRVEDDSGAAVDRAVRELAAAGADLYILDVEALRSAAPELLVTQDVCEVCAVSPDGARDALAAAGLDARLAVCRADSLAGVGRDAIELGEALGRAGAGHVLAHAIEDRLARLHRRTRELPRLRVASLEWLDPPFAGGHWVPQMVRLAGGEDVLGADGEPSRRVTWEDVEAAEPEALWILPCGYDLARAVQAWSEARGRLEHAGSRLARLPAVVLDAHALASRPGPRLARGAEVLASLLHPEAGLPAAAPGEGTRVP